MEAAVGLDGSRDPEIRSVFASPNWADILTGAPPRDLLAVHINRHRNRRINFALEVASDSPVAIQRRNLHSRGALVAAVLSSRRRCGQHQGHAEHKPSHKPQTVAK